MEAKTCRNVYGVVHIMSHNAVFNAVNPSVLDRRDLHARRAHERRS